MKRLKTLTALFVLTFAITFGLTKHVNAQGDHYIECDRVEAFVLHQSYLVKEGKIGPVQFAKELHAEMPWINLETANWLYYMAHNILINLDETPEEYAKTITQDCVDKEWIDETKGSPT